MFESLTTADSLMAYMFFAMLVFLPLMNMFRRAGFSSALGLLIFTPYAGLFICLGYLALKPWPVEPPKADKKKPAEKV